MIVVTFRRRLKLLPAGVLIVAVPLLVPVAWSADNRSPNPVESGRAGAVPTVLPLPAVSSSHTNPIVILNQHKYDLSNKNGLTALLTEVKRLQALSKEEKAEKKSEKKADKNAGRGIESESKENAVGESDNPAGKKAHKALKSNVASSDETDESESSDEEEATSGRRDWTSKKARYGLKALESLGQAIQDGKMDGATGVSEIQEVSWAVESNFIPQYTWRKSVDLADFVLNARNLLLNACGRGNADNPAWNLSSYDSPDLSKVDPKSSSFWSRPSSIADEDLYTPYGRKVNPDLADSICDYDSPHKGNGAHPSFEVDWHDSKWKIKFDEEQSSGPFASRIFWALGFPVDIYDFAPIVKVHWDKRILTKFNSRQLNSMQVKFAHIPITNLRPNKYYDPFNYIGYAVLKDGSHIDATELRKRCFTEAPGHRMPKRPELDHSHYDKKFGATIDYVTLNNASFTTKDPAEGLEEIGNWDYNCLNHAKLREIRGMAVLNAWLDNWDTRWANNRLYVEDAKNGDIQVKQVVSDLGALFGNSTGMLRFVNGKLKVNVYQNAPNDFPWSFTHPQEPGDTTVPIHDYMPDFKTDPFYEMNIDDARWMARLIAQLTEPQIKSALIGAGYEAPIARLLLEKLVARRDQMIRDFGLSEGMKLLRAQQADRHLSYDPRNDGPFEITTASGKSVAARDTGKFIVRDGLLVTRPTRPAPL